MVLLGTAINKSVIINKYFGCLVRYFVEQSPPCTSIRDFFPKIGNPSKTGVQRKRRAKITDQFPTPVYTDPRCLAIIKSRDKDANADYVKEFKKELAKNIKKK